MVYLGRRIHDASDHVLTVMVVTLVGWTALRMKAQDPGLGALARDVIDGALFWGGYTSVLGVLSTVVGTSIVA